MSSKARKLLGLGIAVVILGLLAFSLFYARSTATFPPLPNPNGYDDFVAAGKKVSSQISDFPTLKQAELREVVATNGEALRLCRLGLSRTCSVPTEAVITNFDATMGEIAPLKRLAQLLAAEGRLAEMENRPGDAARSYAEAICLGNETSRGGLLIHRLVGVAMEAIGGNRLARLIPELNGEQSRVPLRLLDDMDRRAVTWDEVMRDEHRFAAHQLRKLPGFMANIVSIWTSRAARAKAQKKHETTVAIVRLTTLELALRCYQADNSGLPATLQELVPKYVSHVPSDPFTGEPLMYKVQGTNWLVYSAGSDGMDNGGVKGADLFYNSSW